MTRTNGLVFLAGAVSIISAAILMWRFQVRLSPPLAITGVLGAALAIGILIFHRQR